MQIHDRAAGRRVNTPGQVLLSSRSGAGSGFTLGTAEEGALRLTLSDGRTQSAWESDAGVLQRDKRHHISVIVDGVSD